MTRLPYRFSTSEVRAARPAPLRGEHNAEVLAEVLGMDPARIEDQALSSQATEYAPSAGARKATPVRQPTCLALAPSGR